MTARTRSSTRWWSPPTAADETADVVDAFERLRRAGPLTQKEMFKATGISAPSTLVRQTCREPSTCRQFGSAVELADAVDDLREALDQPLNRWLRGDKKRISALLDGRFDELVDLAVNRAPFPQT